MSCVCELYPVDIVCDWCEVQDKIKSDKKAWEKMSMMDRNHIETFKHLSNQVDLSKEEILKYKRATFFVLENDYLGFHIPDE